MAEKPKIVGRAIFEILGSPKTHVEETMKMVLDKLAAEKDFRIVKSETFPSEQQENELWSTFSEVEFEVGNFKRIIDMCFDYMPSSVEILEPAGIEVDTNDFSDIFNDLIAKLHRYDMLVKNFNAENIVLKEKLEKMRRDNLALMQKIKG